MRSMLLGLVAAVGMIVAACNTKNNDRNADSQNEREQIEHTTGGGGFSGINTETPEDSSGNAAKREPEKLTVHKGDDSMTYGKYPLVIRREQREGKNDVATLPGLGDMNHLK